MRIVLLSVAGELPNWFEKLAAEYSKKISHLFPFEQHILKSPKVPRDQKDRKIKKEAELLLQFLKPQDFVYLLDERGQSLDSVALSKKMERDFNLGKSRLVFLVGGAFGVGESVRARADFILSLSSLVLSHHIALAVVLEQIYRALTIQKNLPYHND